MKTSLLLAFALLSSAVFAQPSAPPPTSPPSATPPADPLLPLPTDPPTGVVPSNIRVSAVAVRGAPAGVEGNADNIFGGFIVKDGPMRVLVQGIGPRLRPGYAGTGPNFGINSFLQRPMLNLWLGNTDARQQIARNSEWGVQTFGATGSSFANVNPPLTPAQINLYAATLGAQDLEIGSFDAATVIETVPGPYTMEFSAVGSSGTGVLQFFADNALTTAGSFSNVSGRGRVGADAEGLGVVLGIIITGSGTARFSVVALGPHLAGVLDDTLADPHLIVRRVVDGVGVTVAENVRWNTASDPAAIQAALNRSGANITLDPAKADSAVLVTLEPGLYTFEARSASNRTGRVVAGLFLDPES